MSLLIQRRRFLKKSLVATSAGLLLPQFGMIGSALASTSAAKAFGNYRALVCISLDGGNDSWNTLVPRDSTTSGSRFDKYRVARGGVWNSSSNPNGLGLDFNALLPVTALSGAPGGIGMGVHPLFTSYQNGAQLHPGMASLFTSGDLAFLANMGTLVQPITKANYNSTPKPPQLYSHSDQTTQWHLGRTNANHLYGWGGEVASRVSSGNLYAPLAPCISISGSSRFLVGDGVFPYQMSTSGSTALSNHTTSAGSTSGTAYAAQRGALIEQIVREQSYQHPMAQEYANLLTRSIDLAGAVTAGLNSAAGRIMTPYDYNGSNWDPTNNVYPNCQVRYAWNGTNYTTSNSLLDQLRMVARMIKFSHPTLSPGAGVSHERQIYMVRLGGFDTHDSQMAGASGQPLLMARLNQALAWFSKAMADLGISDQVTTFSMSEFARTLESNGNGSDHAWGGIQFVAGGAVSGQRIYGTFPNDQMLNGPDSFSRGQFIPTTPVDTYAATLARWMGVPDIDLEQVFPNLVNFAPDTLPFLP